VRDASHSYFATNLPGTQALQLVCLHRHLASLQSLIWLGLRERFKWLYKGTGGPTQPACMQRLMNFPNQAAVEQFVHLIDEQHQLPLADLIYDDLQHEIW
jgi:hypothetical protein